MLCAQAASASAQWSVQPVILPTYVWLTKVLWMPLALLPGRCPSLAGRRGARGRPDLPAWSSRILSQATPPDRLSRAVALGCISAQQRLCIDQLQVGRKALN